MTPVLHKADVQTEVQLDAKTGEPTGVFSYRWRCSCNCRPGPWQEGDQHGGSHANAARRARNGGQRHVAAMERGR